MADFKLNVLIQAQSNALLSGLAKLIEPEWLRMFNQDELGILISGSKFSLDLVDMRKHTVYSGGYHDNHPVIKSFWKVVSEMTEEDKRGLLCFITSCTRAPLLGFKELNPLICIRNAGTDQERLPTSSTCINLLKLPEFQSEEILKKKLLYSLQSKAGFDLS
ncbi:Ubiquitin-protein ligase E3C [Coelomomyces lativittatus]|nr:Ubiquitin-protein ligase E3C [Coelomomyces lativittatus]KAJ1503050.1 Ubiquitin-protein ligase E3C [Coelomomyces lativittatus]